MMRTLRQIHLYLGVFFAPVIIFFAFTGALQTFDLHKAKGCAAPPPAWIVVAANLHKDQVFKAPKPAAAKACKPDSSAHEKGPSGPSPLPLKLFVTALAAGLIGTALIGVYIALKARHTRRGALIAVVAGVAAPLLLLLI
jgi:hypothetical protein